MRTLAAVVLLSACSQAPPPREFDGRAALRYAEAQMGFGPRIPGTPGHAAMGAWLDSLLRSRADSVTVQAWSHATAAGAQIPMRNFLARFNLAATERILFFAHWDTRPRADAPDSRDTTAAVPGANDGASGVAVLLGVADALKAAPPGIGVDLLFTDGEDYGDFNAPGAPDVLIGAKYFAANLPAGPRWRFAVLFDMVGHAGLRLPKEGNSLTAAPDVVDHVWRVAHRVGHQRIFVDETIYGITDDHVPLQQAGIRAIDLIGLHGYRWWHTPDDTFDKLRAESLQAVGDVAMALVRTRLPR